MEVNIFKGIFNERKGEGRRRRRGDTEAMDQTDTDNTEAAPGPRTRIRLFLRASNLPKSLIAQGYLQPDSLARVSVINPRNEDECTTQTGLGSASVEEDSSKQTFIDETEVSDTVNWCLGAHYVKHSQINS